MRILYLSFLFLASCLPAKSQGLQAEKPKIEDFVDFWKTVYNGPDPESLKSLYAPKVNYYGRTSTPEECVREVSSHTRGNHFLLTIKSDIYYTTYRSGIVKCSFIKGLFYNNVQKELPGYLVLKKEPSGYRIIAEGDRISDQQAGVTPDFGPEVPLELFLADMTPREQSAKYSAGAWVWGILSLVIIVAGSGIFYFRRRGRKSTDQAPSTQGAAGTKQ